MRVITLQAQALIATQQRLLLQTNTDICSTQHSPVHRVGMHGISNLETHFYHHTTIISSIWQQQQRCALAGPSMECGVVGQHYETPYFHPQNRHPPLWDYPAKNSVGLRTCSTASAQVSDVSAPDCRNGVWPLLRPVSVAQKNKPSTMLSSDVQSIDLLMDCMAWRFWMMWQVISSSTPAPRSSAT